MATAEFRFYEELNNFLAPSRRKRSFRHAFADNATVKHAIEALGVPHTEVELILVNGVPVGFSHRLTDGDRVSAYPMFESVDVTPVLKLRPEPLRVIRFITDAHLGALAKRLRLLGFDTRHASAMDDAEIAAISASERRVLLTRDRELLKRKQISHGCYIRQSDPTLQLAYVIQRLDLRRAARPFTRCSECNCALEESSPEAVAGRVPGDVAGRFRRFWTCAGCSRVYWQGSHFQTLSRRVSDALDDEG
jgi:uncharacterized protein with PIN domain